VDVTRTKHRRTYRWRRTPLERRHNAVTIWELWKPNLIAIFVCSRKGHDYVTKFGGARICRRCM
jgi:hypothetical protein